MTESTIDPLIHHPRFFCADCDVDTYVNEHYYMLKNRVWKAIAPDIPDVMLCLPCAEKCLGRSLYRDDFRRVPVNKNQARVCPELADRLRRKA
jgi:hypothetical protein